MLQSSINNDDFDFQKVANRASDIEKILKDYDQQGGSSVFSLKAIRDRFSTIHHYDEPDFIHHFSVVSRRAIELDQIKNCPVAEIGGIPPLRPTSPNAPIFVLPARANAPIGSTHSRTIEPLQLPSIPNVLKPSQVEIFPN